MTRTLTSAMGIALSATLLFAAPMAANAAETDTAATAGFMTAWKAYAGNGATLAATAEPVLADSIETGSIAAPPPSRQPLPVSAVRQRQPPVLPIDPFHAADPNNRVRVQTINQTTQAMLPKPLHTKDQTHDQDNRFPHRRRRCFRLRFLRFRRRQLL